VEYLNDNLGKNYYLKPLLTIIDEILNPFYQQNYWGYSLPNYLSAKHNSHPNYAGYLDSKKTLTVENMDEIFSMMDDGKRSTYDKEYIEQLYLKYMDKEDVQEAHLKDLRQAIAGNTILIIAPGKSSEDEAEIIVKTAKQENVVSISINFEYDKCKTDYIFVSNLRRFKMLSQEKHKKCIVTSNIPAMDVYIQTKYIDLLNSHEFVRDNAGMMLIKLLVKLGARKILLAGMDGYSIDQSQNYAPNDIAYFNNKVTLEAMNKGMNDVIAEFVNQIEIDFVTKPKYIHL
jgi:4-hydroxy 2-oxovalerate aldolase